LEYLDEQSSVRPSMNILSIVRLNPLRQSFDVPQSNVPKNISEPIATESLGALSAGMESDVELEVCNSRSKFPVH
jgi:hypothetical protein